MHQREVSLPADDYKMQSIKQGGTHQEIRQGLIEALGKMGDDMANGTAFWTQ